MPTTPHSNDPRDNLGDYVLGKNGKPIVDRYGRPVRRRTPQQQPPPVQNAPRQYMPSQPSQTRMYEPQPAYEPRRTPQLPPRQPRAGQQRPARQQPPRQRPVRAKRRRKAPGCMTVLVLIVAIIIAGTLAVDTRLNRVDALSDSPIASTAGTNWLLVGSDSRQGLSDDDIARYGTGGDIGSGRTDTIMLLHLPRSGQATLMSIPRDSYVEIPGYGWDKINSAFAYGGPKLLAATVEQSTGLSVDRYAEIGMGGLAGVVDAVGGVNICVSEPIQDPLANLDVQPGCQRMDGATGLGYARTRATAKGDLDRVARQRELLAAIISRITSPAVLANPLRLFPMLWALPNLFTVNTGDHVWNLARVLLAMRSGLRTETVPVSDFMDTDVGNVLIWDDAGAEALFDSMR